MTPAAAALSLLLVLCSLPGGRTTLPDCGPLRGQGAPDLPSCLQLERIVSSPDCAAASAQCCSALQSFLTGRCHCWQGFEQLVLARFDALQASCSSSSQGKGTSAKAGKVHLFVGVLSSAARRRHRDAIRATWARDRRLFRVVFVVAKPRSPPLFAAMQEEAAAKGDMAVLPGIWEAYHNITHQTLEILRLAAILPAVTHVAKVDDDSYVRVGALLERVAQLQPGPSLLGWVENPGGGPHRDTGSQWYVSPEDWPSEKYPPWAHGAGYILTKDLVRQIAAGGAMLALGHRMFKLEDVAMGAWVEWVANAKGWPVAYVGDVRFNFHGCTPTDIVSHYINPEQTLCMYKSSTPICCSKHGRHHSRT